MVLVQPTGYAHFGDCVDKQGRGRVLWNSGVESECCDWLQQSNDENSMASEQTP